MDAETRFEGWFILELMGRKKTAGWVCEITIAGAGFLRVDVPASMDQPMITQFIRPETIYALTPTSEGLAIQAAQHYRPEPVYDYELRNPVRESRPALGFPDYDDRRDDSRDLEF